MMIPQKGVKIKMVWKYGEDALYHWGIKGQKWGRRRYQNPDGTLTAEGRKRYGAQDEQETARQTEYAPKAEKKASDYTDEELRAKINRMQMEKQYRDLAGQTNIRADDQNRELKAEKERLQLKADVKRLKNEINGGQSFVKSVLNDAGKQALTKMATGALLYMGQQGVNAIFKNADFANAVGTGSLTKEKKDDK